MDGLWGPPDYQAIEDTHFGHDECHCAFCLANDVIEERALNEKSCIQVLEIKIRYEDTTITELEDELTDLLSQLVCEDKEFSDMFCMSLKKEIVFLNQSITKLKDKDRDFLSTTIRKPAESIGEKLKSLFCVYMQKQGTHVKIEEIEDAKNPFTGICLRSMKKSKHELRKVKLQTDEESMGFLKSSTLNTKQNAQNTQINSDPKQNNEERERKLKRDSYTVDELKAIAKQRGLKGYSKFRKLELAHALGITIVEGKRKLTRNLHSFES